MIQSIVLGDLCNRKIVGRKLVKSYDMTSSEYIRFTSSYSVPYYKIPDYQIVHPSVNYPSVKKCQFLLPTPEPTVIQGMSCLSIVNVLFSNVLSGWTLRVKSELKADKCALLPEEWIFLVSFFRGRGGALVQTAKLSGGRPEILIIPISSNGEFLPTVWMTWSTSYNQLGYKNQSLGCSF